MNATAVARASKLRPPRLRWVLCIALLLAAQPLSPAQSQVPVNPPTLGGSMRILGLDGDLSARIGSSRRNFPVECQTLYPNPPIVETDSRSVRGISSWHDSLRLPRDPTDSCLVDRGTAETKIDADTKVDPSGVPEVRTAGSVSGKHGCSGFGCGTSVLQSVGFRVSAPNGGSYRVDGALTASGAGQQNFRGAVGAIAEVVVGGERRVSVPSSATGCTGCQQTTQVLLTGDIPRGGTLDVVVNTDFTTDNVFTCCAGAASHDLTFTFFPVSCEIFAIPGQRTDGTSGDDEICGSPGDDVIFGNAGDDHIHGGNGGDEIAGDDGDDFIDGGPGVDRIFGSAGDDVIYGGEFGSTNDRNSNTIDGGSGSDRIFGGSFDDIILGGPDAPSSSDADADFVDGGGGADRVLGGRGNDTIFVAGSDGFVATVNGGGGDDSIFGGSGPDSIAGGEGNDTLQGFQGDDVLVGEGGEDSLYGGLGNDQLFGDGGSDKLDAEDYVGPAYFDLDVSYRTRAHVGEKISGGGMDKLRGDAGVDSLFADDPPFSNDPADSVDGGDGIDLCSSDGGLGLPLSNLDPTPSDTRISCDTSL